MQLKNPTHVLRDCSQTSSRGRISFDFSKWKRNKRRYWVTTWSRHKKTLHIPEMCLHRERGTQNLSLMLKSARIVPAHFSYWSDTFVSSVDMGRNPMLHSNAEKIEEFSYCWNVNRTTLGTSSLFDIPIGTESYRILILLEIFLWQTYVINKWIFHFP